MHFFYKQVNPLFLQKKSFWAITYFKRLHNLAEGDEKKGADTMKIEKVMTYYGYDLLINEVLHKKCLKCEKWYKFERELGYCYSCIREMKEKGKG